MRTHLRRPLVPALIGILCLAAGSAHAGLYNVSTGLDASDNVILTGNVNDAHWTVDQPSGGIAPARVDNSPFPGFAGFSWLADGPNSSWITIDPNNVGNAPVIPYTYYRQFTLTAAQVPLAYLTGVWGIDDQGEVRLNGNLLSTSAGDYNMATPVGAAAGSGLFVAGVNTLTITMTASDNFLEAVRLQGTVSLVPEPSSLALALSGIAFAVVVRHRARRRRR